eukprot:600043-Prymnesium_polylepis.1
MNRGAGSTSVRALCRWPVVRRKAVLERYAALRCLWHKRADPWPMAYGAPEGGTYSSATRLCGASGTR